MQSGIETTPTAILRDEAELPFVDLGDGTLLQLLQADLANGVWEEVAQFRDILDSALSLPEFDTISVGNRETRLPNTLCLIAKGWKGETQVMAMDLAGLWLGGTSFFIMFSLTTASVTLLE